MIGQEGSGVGVFGGLLMLAFWEAILVGALLAVGGFSELSRPHVELTPEEASVKE
jgi:hypothetical protein